MATRNPLVQAGGEVQQLQSGDPLSPAGVGVLRVVDVVATLPDNTSLISADSFKANNGADFKIPNTSSLLVRNTNTPRIPYWDTIARVSGSNFTTTSGTLVDITGLSFVAAANTLYTVNCILATRCSTANGIKLGWHFTSTGAEFLAVLDTANTTGNAQFFMPAVDTGSTIFNLAVVDTVLNIKGYVKTGATSGTISLRALSQTVGDTTTIYIGSVMKIKNEVAI